MIPPPLQGSRTFPPTYAGSWTASIATPIGPAAPGPWTGSTITAPPAFAGSQAQWPTSLPPPRAIANRDPAPIQLTKKQAVAAEKKLLAAEKKARAAEVKAQKALAKAAPPVPEVPEGEPELCAEQQALVELICSGQNVFYTGSAGCGKSTVLKAFVRRLRSGPGKHKRVHIIAPTGRAALDINGSTFWTYAGWTPDHMKKPLKDLRAAQICPQTFHRD